MLWHTVQVMPIKLIWKKEREREREIEREREREREREIEKREREKRERDETRERDRDIEREEIDSRYREDRELARSLILSRSLLSLSPLSPLSLSLALSRSLSLSLSLLALSLSLSLSLYPSLPPIHIFPPRIVKPDIFDTVGTSLRSLWGDFYLSIINCLSESVTMQTGFL